jgi:hypothetical protein
LGLKFIIFKGRLELDGLIVKKEWLDKILAGEKTIEVRGSDCPKHTGKIIALIEAKSGLIMGTAYLSTSCIVQKDYFHYFYNQHLVKKDMVKYKNIWLWGLKHAVKFSKPVPYIHPPGAQMWVKDVL